VRRLALRVRRSPRLLEEIDIATFCSGAARLWAERSSLVTAAGAVVAEAQRTSGERRATSCSHARFLTSQPTNRSLRR
jgi:hypothetical protein